MELFKPEYLIKHHSVTDPDLTREELYDLFISMDYDDIGYHRIVTGMGDAYDGRPMSVKGAHCIYGGFNSKSIGLCSLGNFEEHQVPAVQYSRTVKEAAKICYENDIPVKNVLGHRETGEDTLCPGKYFDMDQFRADIEHEIPYIKFFL